MRLAVRKQEWATGDGGPGTCLQGTIQSFFVFYSGGRFCSWSAGLLSAGCTGDQVRGIYREANQQIVSYSDAVSSQGAELTKAQSQVKESDDTVEAASAQIAQEQKKSSTYQALLEAYAAYKQQNMDEAALKLQNVYVNVLPDDLKSIYNTISNDTGVAGIDESADGSESSSAAGQTDSSGDNADSAGDTGAEDSGEGYSDSGDGSYDDSSYDDSSYDDSSYDDGTYDDGSYDEGN